MSREPYFAALPSAELAERLMSKVDEFYAFSKGSNRTQRIAKSRAVYNGMTVNSTGSVAWDIIKGGQQGELLQSVENHYRTIIDAKVTDVTAQRPAIQCQAKNADYRSLAQAILGNGILDNYLTERGLERMLKRACRGSLVDSEAFIAVTWDAAAGEAYAAHPDAVDASFADPSETPDGMPAPTKAGDVAFVFLGPLDVIRDEHATSFDSLAWLITRTWRNRYDAAAQFPELSDDILGLTSKADTERRVGAWSSKHDNTDLIPEYTFHHRPSPALPKGRLMTFLSNTVWTADCDYPYGDDLGVYPCFADELEDTPFGSSPVHDCLGPQDAVNAIDSSIITNELGRGIGNVVVDDDADISVEAISSSMNLIKKKRGTEVKPLEWPATPPELFSMKQEKINAIRTLSGVNSVRLGDPSAAVGSDSSGAKLALLEAQAIKSNSSLENNYVRMIRQVCLAILRRLRDFGGDAPRFAKLAGKNGQYLVKEFTADDVKGVDRVTVDIGSAMQRTITGRMSIADKLVEMGVVKTADQYLMLVKAGTYEPLLESEQSIQMRIRSENEALMEGGFHKATIADPHWLEIPQHLTVLDNPSLREPTPENATIQEAVLTAVQDHLDLFRQMDPALVMLRGGEQAMAIWQAMQPQMPVAMPPGAPTAAPPQGESGAGAALGPEMAPPEQPQMPKQPNNPMTGQPNDQGVLQ